MDNFMDFVKYLKLLKPQNGDLIIADFNKVNITQLEKALEEEKLNVAVIGVHNIDTIKLFGLTAKKEVEVSQEELETIIPKPAPTASQVKAQQATQTVTEVQTKETQSTGLPPVTN